VNGDVLETVGRVGVMSAAIGRQRELAPLVAALSAAVDGRGGTCVISLEAGIGKTPLLGELISRASDLGCRVLSGQAGDYDRGLAYSTLKDVLSSAGFSAGELEKLTAVIAGVTGDRAQWSGAAGPELGPVAVPPFVVAAECLRSMAARQPMVVAVDDAHLADEETLRALALAGRKAAALSLLLVFTVRRDSWRPGTSFAASVGRLGECLAAAARVHGTTLTSWHDAWVSTEECVSALADSELAKGPARRSTACSVRPMAPATTARRGLALFTMPCLLDGWTACSSAVRSARSAWPSPFCGFVTLGP